jgi:hypothetical protein
MASNPNIVSIQVVDQVAPSIAKNIRAIGTAAKSTDANIKALQTSLATINTGAIAQLQNASNVASQANLAASQQLSSATTQLTNVVNNLTTALTRKTGAVKQAVTATNQLSSAHKKGVTDIQATSGAIRVLEGNFGTNVRAAENFIVKILGLGPIMRAAFPVIGAMALIGVIDILAEHVGKVVDAFKRLSGAETDAEIQAIKTGEKILKIKPEGFLNSTNFAKLLIGDFTANKDIQVTNAQAMLKQIQNEKEVLAVQEEVNERGLTGVALVQAKTKAMQQDIIYTQNAAKAADDLAKSYERQLKASHVVGGDTGPSDIKSLATVKPKVVRDITDPGQIKALTDQMRTAKEAAAQFNQEAYVMAIRVEGVAKGEGLARLHDGLEAARKQAKEFAEQMGELNQKTDHVVTPQERLALVNKQLDVALPPNKPTLEVQKGTLDQEIARQNRYVDELSAKYQDQVENIGLYNDALRLKHIEDKIDIDLAKLSIDANDIRVKQAKDNAKYAIENAGYERELQKVYSEFNAPLRTYQDTIRAINTLEQEHTISVEDGAIAINKATRDFKSAIDPLNEYNISLEHQTALLGKYGEELRIATEIDSLRQSLQKQGRDLSEDQVASLTQQLTQIERQKQVQNELNAIYDKTTGERLRLVATEQALKQAVDDELISWGKYKLELLNINLAQDQIVNAAGQGNFTSHFRQMLAGLVDTTHTVSEQMTAIWTDFFKTLDDGFANSIGKWAVGLEPLKKGLVDLARNAVAQLIASFVKLGIEVAIIYTLEKAFPKLAKIFESNKGGDKTKEIAKNTAVSIASIAAIATAEYAMINILLEPAWELAEAISLISFGANAIGATAGIEAVQSAGQAGMSGAFGGFFAKGGLITGLGSGTSDQVPIMASHGEFIMSAAAVNRIGLNTLDYMNKGYTPRIQAPSNSSPQFVGSTNVRLEVIHDGNTDIQTEQMSDGKIRIIAKQIALATVNQETPKLMSAHLDDANSTVSKSMQRNYKIPRNRG